MHRFLQEILKLLKSSTIFKTKHVFPVHHVPDEQSELVHSFIGTDKQIEHVDYGSEWFSIVFEVLVILFVYLFNFTCTGPLYWFDIPHQYHLGDLPH